jgi:hypothetical protein
MILGVAPAGQLWELEGVGIGALETKGRIGFGSIHGRLTEVADAPPHWYSSPPRTLVCYIFHEGFYVIPRRPQKLHPLASGCQ